MARKDSYPDEEDADDPENPDESDTHGDDDGSDVVECPWCRSEISEYAERCPRCGRYVSDEDARGRKPAWIIATTVVLLVAILISWVLWGG